MRKFYRLINFEFRAIVIPASLISLAALLIPLFLIHNKMKNVYESSIHERFEHIYVQAGCVYVFIVLLVILCLWFLKNVYANYWGSQSIYTLLTLPVKRASLYFSKIIAFVIALLMLMTSQLVSVFWSYQIVIARIEPFDAGQYVMTNGLYLAFIRSDFLRLLFPLTFEGIISSISIGALLITGLYYGALCERSKRYWGFAILLIAAYLFNKVIQLRVGSPINLFYDELPYIIVWSLLLFVISGFFVWHSIRFMKKGAITS